jgi:DNA-binding protein H-NS
LPHVERAARRQSPGRVRGQPTPSWVNHTATSQENLMAKTLVAIQRQIDKLQQEAQRLKAKEAQGVVQRIRSAIAHYGLTAADLFGAAPSAAKRKGKAGAAKTRRKGPSPIRYRDEHGNSWTGHGQRPRWFKEAIAGGKTREELEVKN